MAIIKLKRGNKASLPANPNAGEPLLAWDTGELFYGDSASNRQPVKVDKTNVMLGTDMFLSAADKSKLDGIAAGATKVEDSTTNGNIKINGVENIVYTHPSTHPATMITATVSGISGTEVDTILNNLKVYIDNSIQGLDIKASVRAATTVNITTSGTQTIDGISCAVGDRVLVKNQTTASQNGIYVVQTGAWTRATDFDDASSVTPNSFVFVEQGTVNEDSGWVLITNSPITVGTTALTFSQFSGAGQIVPGWGLQKSGNELSVKSADLDTRYNNAIWGDDSQPILTSGNAYLLGENGIYTHYAGTDILKIRLDSVDGGTF